MNGYDQRSLAFMAEARKTQRMPEPATTKPAYPRESVGSEMAEAVGSDELAFLVQMFGPQGVHHMGGDCWMTDQCHMGDDDEEWPSDDEDWAMAEAPLTTKRRKALPASDFALPGRRYPIDTPARARAALSRIEQFGTTDEKRRVRAAVKRRYPNMDVEMPGRSSSRRSN